MKTLHVGKGEVEFREMDAVRWRELTVLTTSEHSPTSGCIYGEMVPLTSHKEDELNLINESEARDRLHLPKHTLRRLRRQGLGPRFFVVSRRIYYRMEDLEAWVQACTTTPQNTTVTHSKEGDNHA